MDRRSGPCRDLFGASEEKGWDINCTCWFLVCHGWLLATVALRTCLLESWC